MLQTPSQHDLSKAHADSSVRTSAGEPVSPRERGTDLTLTERRSEARPPRGRGGRAGAVRGPGRAGRCGLCCVGLASGFLPRAQPSAAQPPPRPHGHPSKDKQPSCSPHPPHEVQLPSQASSPRPRGPGPPGRQNAPHHPFPTGPLHNCSLWQEDPPSSSYLTLGPAFKLRSRVSPPPESLLTRHPPLCSRHAALPFHAAWICPRAHRPISMGATCRWGWACLCQAHPPEPSLGIVVPIARVSSCCGKPRGCGPLGGSPGRHGSNVSPALRTRHSPKGYALNVVDRLQCF